MVGTPRVTMHLEAETEDCICPRLPLCGGIETWQADCPEHGIDAGKMITRYHTHPVQANRINPGRTL